MQFHFGLVVLDSLLIFITLTWKGGHCKHTSPKFDSGKDDLGSFSKEDLSQLLDEIISRRQTRRNECVDDFQNQTGLIIRTRDSIKNGAEFLSAPSSADTPSKCQLECCKAYSKNITRPCDLAVFQEEDDDPTDLQPRCFLFSCTKDGKFSCLTSVNKDYSVFRRTVHNGAEDQLLDVAENEQDSVTEIVTTSTAPTPTTTSTAATTSTTTTKATTSTPEPTTVKNTLLEAKCTEPCSRLQWKCDNGCCISVKNVCDEKSDCTDGSDESMCDDAAKPSSVGDTIDTAKTTVAATAKPSSVTTTPHQPQNSGSNPTPSDSAAVDLLGAAINEDVIGERTSAQRGAVLPLALGLSVTACVLLMVICRLRIMKKKLHRKGKPLTMEESDYLINGMYL